MPVLARGFRTFRERVIALLKTVQMSTRYLQHVCGHSKVEKDVSLTVHVPEVKKLLELFIFKTKVRPSPFRNRFTMSQSYLGHAP